MHKVKAKFGVVVCALVTLCATALQATDPAHLITSISGYCSQNSLSTYLIYGSGTVGNPDYYYFGHVLSVQTYFPLLTSFECFDGTKQGTVCDSDRTVGTPTNDTNNNWKAVATTHITNGGSVAAGRYDFYAIYFKDGSSAGFSPSPRWTSVNCPALDACWSGGCGNSPISIPLGHAVTAHYTSAADGVQFDIDGDGVPEQVAWFADVNDAGWLGMDKNGNGVIDNGGELLGNHFDPNANNGFDALLKMNPDPNVTSIAAGTESFDKLVIWQDVNRDGISQPSEVFPASQVLTRIYLGFMQKRRTDPFGNEYKWQGWADFKAPNMREHVPIYDINLVTQ